MSEPTWLTIARSYVGLKEVAGDGDNPTIVAWAAELGGWVKSFYLHDSIPWCGLFVGICAKRAGLPLPQNTLGAKNWATWGQHVATPVPGAVMVFERTGGGHVAFYIGEDEEAYHTLGGNQSDSVNITRIAKNRCIAVRWPEGIEITGEPVLLSFSGQALSVNEG